MKTVVPDRHCRKKREAGRLTQTASRNGPNSNDAGPPKLRGTPYFFNIIAPPASKPRLGYSGCVNEWAMSQGFAQPAHRSPIDLLRVGTGRAGFFAISCVPCRLTDPSAVFSKKGQPLPRMTRFRYREAWLQAGVSWNRLLQRWATTFGLAKNRYSNGFDGID